MSKKKFTIQCTVPVYYDVHIEADSKEEAEKLFRDTEGDYSIFENYEDHGEIEIFDIHEEEPEPDIHWYEINYTVPVYCLAVIPAKSEEEALEKFNKEHDYEEDMIDRGAPKITETKRCENV